MGMCLRKIPPPKRRGEKNKKEELMKMFFWNIRGLGVLVEENS